MLANPFSRIFPPRAVTGIVFLVFLAASAHATPRDQEKRSTIVEVDAYAQLSEEKSIREVRREAFGNARRQALENAEVYIKSQTRVENFQLQYDLVESGAEGVVKVLEQKDLGIEDNSRYHVWIKAEVSYVLESPPEPTGPAPASHKAPLTVTVWTKKKSYREGENITIYLEGNRDFYARIVNIGSSGRVIQLLPNAYRQVNHFEGGRLLGNWQAGSCRISLPIP